MEDNGISIRYDDGRSEFVLELTIKGLRTFEASDILLSEALANMAEQLDQEGV